jgi:hypothetical protein
LRTADFQQMLMRDIESRHFAPIAVCSCCGQLQFICMGFPGAPNMLPSFTVNMLQLWKIKHLETRVVEISSLRSPQDATKATSLCSIPNVHSYHNWDAQYWQNFLSRS